MGREPFVGEWVEGWVNSETGFELSDPVRKKQVFQGQSHSLKTVITAFLDNFNLNIITIPDYSGWYLHLTKLGTTLIPHYTTWYPHLTYL